MFPNCQVRLHFGLVYALPDKICVYTQVGKFFVEQNPISYVTGHFYSLTFKTAQNVYGKNIFKHNQKGYPQRFFVYCV